MSNFSFLFLSLKWKNRHGQYPNKSCKQKVTSQDLNSRESLFNIKAKLYYNRLLLSILSRKCKLTQCIKLWKCLFLESLLSISTAAPNIWNYKKMAICRLPSYRTKIWLIWVQCLSRVWVSNPIKNIYDNLRYNWRMNLKY